MLTHNYIASSSYFFLFSFTKGAGGLGKGKILPGEKVDIYISFADVRLRLRTMRNRAESEKRLRNSHAVRERHEDKTDNNISL